MPSGQQIKSDLGVRLRFWFLKNRSIYAGTMMERGWKTAAQGLIGKTWTRLPTTFSTVWIFVLDIWIPNFRSILIPRTKKQLV